MHFFIKYAYSQSFSLPQSSLRAKRGNPAIIKQKAKAGLPRFARNDDGGS